MYESGYGNFTERENVLKKLLQHPSTKLLVTGSLVCQRTIYFRAARLGYTGQIRCCNIQEKDYILGDADKKILSEAMKCASENGVRLIILYLSCLELLIGLDTESIVKVVEEKFDCKMAVFFRGPLSKFIAKKNFLAEKYAEEIKGDFCDRKRDMQLPPPAPGVSVLPEFFYDSDVANIIITPGGCLNLLEEVDSVHAEKVYAAKMDEADCVFGAEKHCIKQIIEIVKKVKTEKISVYSTSVPAFMGYNDRLNLQELEKSNFAVDFYQTTGFREGITSAADFLYRQLKEICDFDGNAFVKPIISILGHSPLLCGSRQQYDALINLMTKYGYQCIFNAFPKDGRPAAMWAVSSAGLKAAHHFREVYGIPLSMTIPLRSQDYKNFLENLLSRKITCCSSTSAEKEDQRRVLIAGEPLQIWALRNYLLSRKKFASVRCLVYDRDGTVSTYCKAVMPKHDYIYFGDSEQLKKIAGGFDVLIADPLLSDFCACKEKISLPWGYVSGKKAAGLFSGIMSPEFIGTIDKFIERKDDLL